MYLNWFVVAGRSMTPLPLIPSHKLPARSFVMACTSALLKSKVLKLNSLSFIFCVCMSYTFYAVPMVPI